MTDDTTLIATIVVAFVLAVTFGFGAVKLRVPPLVGYLLAGIALGPFTPGIVADTNFAGQLAEIGVILLMFGVGLHFSFKDLFETRRIALPGAIAQMASATVIGAALAISWEWGIGAGIVFGLSLSVASSVVLLRALEQRKALDSPEGRIAMGWLIIEDVAMVLAVVILPVLTQPPGAAGGAGIAIAVALVLGKIAVFVALALVVGTRVVPWLLTRVAATGSGELFTLAVLALALGIAYGSAEVFDVSLALGAFFAGVVLSESELSQRAAADSLPLKDAFAVLFFVSVGMLFDPAILVHEPLAVVAVLGVILLCKSVVAFAIVRAFGYSAGTALTVSAGLAQIGEFSFILAGLGAALGVLPVEGRDLILAGAILSIALNPLAFVAIPAVSSWVDGRPKKAGLCGEREVVEHAHSAAASHAAFRDHAVIVGYGRVGGKVGPMLARSAVPFVAVDRDRNLVAQLRERGIAVVYGEASADGVLDAAGARHARVIVIATPEGFQTRRILEVARALNPLAKIAVRTHSEAELGFLESTGADIVLLGEQQLAVAIGTFALACFGSAEDRQHPNM
jgi:CPA2 family monovalent cation:H+ antiporter-2